MSGVELSEIESTSLAHLLRRVHGDRVLRALAARLPSEAPSGRDSLFPPVFEAYHANGANPGTMEITIGRKAEVVLTYERNYHSFGISTFAPFKIGDRWLALASRDYTCTELLDLTTGCWIGGEQPDALGFCPVELFVPRWRSYRRPDRQADELSYVTECEPEANLLLLERRAAEGKIEWVGTGHASVGFVAGCIWGDDHSWKVETFDLRRAGEGRIERAAPWGYAEMPDWARELREAIRFEEHWTPDDTHCCLASFLRADATSSKREDAPAQ